MTRIEAAARSMQDDAALQGAELDIRVRDLGAEFVLTYHFRNGEDRAIEALFTFPMPAEAAFVGLEADIAGEVLAARVLPRREATAEYDEAIAEGHSALLLEQVQPGLLHASLGNLGPGERASVTLRYALALTATEGRARLRLPCAIRPRYGHWDVDDIHVPWVDPSAAYTLAASVRIEGMLAEASVACPTHTARFLRDGDAMRVELLEAWLDGDFVLDFALPTDPGRAERMARAEAFADGDAFGALAHVVIPDWGAPEPGHLDVVLVLDGSGSMTGDAVRGCRHAMIDLVEHLHEGDRIQVLRFGSEVRPLLRRPLKATPQVRKALQDAADTIDAELGGTEIAKAMERALTDIDRLASGGERQRAIVLVTDGAVHPREIAEVSRKARQADVRVFVVAVGSSATVDVLRPLAEDTQGQLEAVVPGESIRHAVVRQLRRMRHAAPIEIRCEFDAEARDLVAPTTVYGGDAIRVAARLGRKPERCLVFGPWVAPLAVTVRGTEPDPARRALLGQMLFEAAASDAERQGLATSYGLLTEFTSAVVVRERTGEEQFNALPESRVQPQMLPRGIAAADMALRACLIPARAGSDDAACDYLELPAFMSRVDAAAPVPSLPAEAVSRALSALREAVLREALVPEGAFRGFASLRTGLSPAHLELLGAVLERLGLDVDSDHDWMVLVDALFELRPLPKGDVETEEALAQWMLAVGGAGAGACPRAGIRNQLASMVAGR